MSVFSCSPAITCPSLYYFTDAAFYGYPNFTYPISNTANKYQTIFKRFITMSYGGQNKDQKDQVVVTATVKWVDGATPRSISQSMVIANWTP